MESRSFLELQDTDLAEHYLKLLHFVLARQLGVGLEYTWYHLSEDKLEDYFETCLFTLREALKLSISIEKGISIEMSTAPLLLRLYFEMAVRYAAARFLSLDTIDAEITPVFITTPEIFSRLEDYNITDFNIPHLRNIWGILSNYGHCNVPLTQVKQQLSKKRITLINATYLYWLGDAVITKENLNESLFIQCFLAEIRALWFCIQRIHEYARSKQDQIHSQKLLEMELTSLVFRYSREAVSEEFKIKDGPYHYACETLLNPESIPIETLNKAKEISAEHLRLLASGIDITVFDMPKKAQ